MFWSYLLASVGILGIYLAGRMNIWGWVVGFSAQILWIIYALVTDQPGFIVSAVAYGFVYARNWHRWYTKDRTEIKFEYIEEDTLSDPAVDKLRKEYREFITGSVIDHTYLCTRSWDAWQYGTMTEDDFVLVTETDVFDDLVSAAKPLFEYIEEQAETIRHLSKKLSDASWSENIDRQGRA